MAVVIKSPQEIAIMREAGRILHRSLHGLAPMVKPGVTSLEIDREFEKRIRAAGATPSFKGYQGFPASICISVNQELVHGIPSNRRFREGDLVSLDVGLIYKGWQADMAITIPVGKIDEQRQLLLQVTEQSLLEGINAARGGARLGDIGHAIQTYIEQHGFGVVREYVGHGIGRQLHEKPQVPNFGQPGTGDKLVPGMCLALEPMVTIGDYRTKVMPDHWTVITADGSLCAHFEHTIAVTDGEPEILTAP